MSAKTYDFRDQLLKGQEYELKLDEYFSQWYDIKPVDMEGQLKGIDRIFTNGERTIAVEYKTDFITQKTGNVFIETTSVVEAGKLGWAWTSQADILVYLTIPNTIYIANPYDIRDHIPFWIDQFGKRQVKNSNYTSTGIPLPVEHFARICKVRSL